jgi:hypothetical protein
MKNLLTLSLIVLSFAACSTNAPVIEDDPALAAAQLGAGTSTQIVPAHLTSPLCVAPNVGTPAPGALLYQSVCTTTASSMSTPQPVVGQPGVFQIKNDATSKLCFDVNRNSNSDGTSVILWTCHGRSNQLWNLKRVTDTVVDEQQNAFQVISMRSKKCLEVKGAATSAGAPLQIATCKIGDIKDRKNQVFYFNGIKQTDLAACSRPLTEANIEGPFFTANSPKRNNLLEPDTQGMRLTLSGWVLTPDCKPVANTLVDFWQANSLGEYDNVGYKLRGHQFTDAAGRFTLQTIIPGEYPARTEHIHVKVHAPGDTNLVSSAALTTQLYFPDVPKNDEDDFILPSLILKLRDGSNNDKIGYYSFVIPRLP